MVPASDGMKGSDVRSVGGASARRDVRAPAHHPGSSSTGSHESASAPAGVPDR